MSRRAATGAVGRGGGTTLAIALAVLAAGASSTLPAQPLGRLFFSPAERARLDAEREAALRPKTAPIAPPGAAVGPAGPKTLRVDGVLTRSDGPATVWIDGELARPGHGPEVVRIERPQTAAEPLVVRLPGDGRRVPVRVGQEVDLSTGRVRERFHGLPPAGADPREPPADVAPQTTAGGPSERGRGSRDPRAAERPIDEDAADARLGRRP